jgi:NADP-dependent 3-hydroxy acid dehydrogenase YdfG
MSEFCKDKVAVVTGAGGTLCSAIAKDLARKGAKVVLIGRTREKLEKVADAINRVPPAGGSQFTATAGSQRRIASW